MTKTHWTDESAGNFRYYMAHNFIAHVESKLEDREITHSAFAKLVGVSKGRISRVFKKPGNLTFDTVVRWCRALEMKPSLIVYDDVDTPTHEAPVHPEVFVSAWKALGCPVDMWDFSPSFAEVDNTLFEPNSHETVNNNDQRHLTNQPLAA